MIEVVANTYTFGGKCSVRDAPLPRFHSSASTLQWTSEGMQQANSLQLTPPVDSLPPKYKGVSSKTSHNLGIQRATSSYMVTSNSFQVCWKSHSGIKNSHFREWVYIHVEHVKTDPILPFSHFSMHSKNSFITSEPGPPMCHSEESKILFPT
ncbi:hypothetical protein OCU04_002396 [Sclerotinia nivalis]|uniref:Uncharacterized protein n=1 Tax=Sclerotinia nivalis TaxID=352851 RepID=A0A9X0ATJ1_9HELO|nr:hypothetical protein OCU04_002396 [Sclerotinia nivalis]